MHQRIISAANDRQWCPLFEEPIREFADKRREDWVKARALLLFAFAIPDCQEHGLIAHDLTASLTQQCKVEVKTARAPKIVARPRHPVRE